MLPILRIIPVGGVFFAILILVLALGAPERSRSGKGVPGQPLLTVRGPLQQLDEHPEWRQFWIQAALRRAEALNQLRELADEPASAQSSDKSQDESVNVALLPAERSDTEPEDVTGSVNAAPAAILPMEIGEASSTELPTLLHDERPPVIKTPGRVKSKVDVKKKTARRFRRAKPPVKPPEPANLFEAIFGIPATRQASTATQPANQPAVATDTQTR